MFGDIFANLSHYHEAKRRCRATLQRHTPSLYRSRAQATKRKVIAELRPWQLVVLMFAMFQGVLAHNAQAMRELPTEASAASATRKRPPEILEILLGNASM